MISDMGAGLVVADGAVEGVVGGDIKFRLHAAQRRQAGLGVAVDGEDAIAAQGKMLHQMHGGRRFAAAPFEIDGDEDLQLLLAAPMRQVAAGCTAILIEMTTQLLDLQGSVGTTSARGQRGRGAFAFKRQVAQIGAFDAKKLRRLVQLKGAERFFSRGRKEFATMRIQAFGQVLRLARNQSRDIDRLCALRKRSSHVCHICDFAR